MLAGGNYDFFRARLRKVENDRFVYLICPSAEHESFMRLECPVKPKVARRNAGFFLGLAERCFQTFFLRFNFPFREIPIAVPVIEQQKFHALFRASVDDNARRNLPQRFSFRWLHNNTYSVAREPSPCHPRAPPLEAGAKWGRRGSRKIVNLTLHGHTV